MSATTLRLLSLLLILLGWQFVVWVLHPQLLPGPLEILHRIQQEFAEGELSAQLAITLKRLAWGFCLAMLCGAALGLLMARYSSVNAVLDLPVTLLLNIPALVVIILCFIWIGLNETAAITAVVVNKVPTIAVMLREGGRAVDQKLLEVGQAFQLPPWQRFSKIYFPQLYPHLLAAIRTGLSLVWKIILVVELLGCSNGIGFKLGVFFQYFDIAGILAYSVVFAGIMLLVDAFFIRRWEAATLAWRQTPEGRYAQD